MNRSCNRQTGQCHCRPNVTGRACDHCVAGFWNLESSRNGCRQCQCNAVGSHDMHCNIYTGQCNCKPGVGGEECDRCLDDHYGFTANGCKSKIIFYKNCLFVCKFCSLLYFRCYSNVFKNVINVRIRHSCVTMLLVAVFVHR